MYPELLHLGPITIYSFGVMAALALIAAAAVAYGVLRVRGFGFELAYELFFVAGIAGFVGARVYYLVQHWSAVNGHLASSVFGGSGFTWYGGFIGGFIAVLVWSYLRHVPIGLMANAAGPAVAVGYAVGRIGCLLSGDGDYGKPTTAWFGIAFPHGTVPTPPGVHVYPTPPMETVAMLLVGLFLYRMAKKPQPGWYVFGWFLVLSGIERFLIEFIRRNPAWILGLTAPQWESVVSVVAGVVLILYTRRKPTVEEQMEKALRGRAARRRAARPRSAAPPGTVSR